MEGIVFLLGLFIGWLIIIWKDVTWKEKVGEVFVLLSKKSKLCRVVEGLMIPIGLSLYFVKNLYIKAGASLFCFCVILLATYIDIEEQIKSAKRVLIDCDPKVIKEFEEKRRFGFGIIAVKLGFCALFALFLLFK